MVAAFSVAFAIFTLMSNHVAMSEDSLSSEPELGKALFNLEFRPGDSWATMQRTVLQVYEGHSIESAGAALQPILKGPDAFDYVLLNVLYHASQIDAANKLDSQFRYGHTPRRSPPAASGTPPPFPGSLCDSAGQLAAKRITAHRMYESLDPSTPYRALLKSVLRRTFDPDRIAASLAPETYALGSLSYHVHPLSFAIADSFIAAAVPPKSRILCPIIPNNRSTYMFEDSIDLTSERDYLWCYRTAMFGVTFRKAGHDCMRHLEIMAAGAVPLFSGIDARPPRALAAYPTELLSTLLQFPGVSVVYKDPLSYLNADTYRIDESRLDMEAYYVAAASLLQYTRSYLSTQALALRILRTLGHCPTGPVLLLTSNNSAANISVSGDYLSEALLHGLVSLGIDVVDYPRRDGVRNGPADLDPDRHLERRLWTYGKGFSSCCLVDELEGSADRSLEGVRRRVLDMEFDLVIVATVERFRRYQAQPPLLAEVCSTYPRSRVAIVHGGDEPISMVDAYLLGECGVLFARELDDPWNPFGAPGDLMSGVGPWRERQTAAAAAAAAAARVTRAR